MGQDNIIMKWYVIQVYAGYEAEIKEEVEKRSHKEGLQDLFGEVLVPSAKSKKFFADQDLKTEQLFPGYMLIQMDCVPEAMRIVTSCLRVVRFLGGKHPVHLSQKEVDRILSQMRGDVAIVSSAQNDFSVGSEVEIAEGLFVGFVGIVDKVEPEQEKLTVMISIFGRMTPVEINYNQIKL